MKEISIDEYRSAKEVVSNYEKQFWNKYNELVTELERYFSKNLVCGKKITKFETYISVFNEIYVLPTNPRFTRLNFSPQNIDKKAMDDVKNIGERHKRWSVSLSYMG